MFYRLHTDHTRTDVSLENQFAGSTSSACWLLGGGPSLKELPTSEIAASPVPKMAINLAGSRLIRPTFWTSYDPSARFHKSIYLDAGVIKFVHCRRALDLVPETTHKVCDSPQLYFFDRDPQRGFADFLRPGQDRIVDWADSCVQAIDILYRLGFRTLYLAGCEMQIHPSTEQIAAAEAVGVTYDPSGTLRQFLAACEQAGLTLADLARCTPCDQYHFGEQKPLAAAAQTDAHYHRIVQYLRLSRRALALAGLRLISVTPASRLNDFFEYRPVADVLADLRTAYGDPAAEPVTGLYTDTPPRHPPCRSTMRDYRPPHARTTKPLPPPAGEPFEILQEIQEPREEG